MALTKISTGGVKDDAVSQAIIADETIDEARLQISNAGSNGQFLSKQSGNTGGLTWATAVSAINDDDITQAKIADEAVDEARLQISNAGSNGQYLQKQSGNTGGLTWADVSAGPEVTLVADGAIGANKPVIIKSNGKAGAVVETISVNDPGTITASTQRTVNGNPTAQGQRLMYDQYSGMYLYYGRNSSNYQEVFVGKSGGKNITPVELGGGTGAWTPTAITGSGTGFIGTTKDCGLNPSHVEITSNNGWVAWLVKDQDGDGKTWIVTGKTSQDDTSSFESGAAGHCHQVGTVADTRNTAAASLIYCGDNQLAVIYADDSDGNKGYIRVGTVSNVQSSSSTLTWGTATAISDGYLHVNGVACDTANKKIMLLGRGGAASGNDTVVNSVVITVDTDNSVSVGTWVTGIQTGNFNNPTMLFDPDTDRFVCAYYHDGSAYDGQIRVGSISGTTPSWGSEVEFVESTNGPWHIDLAYHEAIKRVIISYNDGDNDYIRVKQAEISSSSNTCTVTSNYVQLDAETSSTQVTDTSVVYDTKEKHIVVGWAYGFTSLRIRAVDFGSASSNATTSNFIGFSDAAYSDAANATIQVAGNANTGQSGMTVGTKQYVQNNGDIGTTVTDVPAGISLSATKLLIKA